MNRLQDWLMTHWFAATLVGVALLLGLVLLFLRRRSGSWSVPLLATGGVLGLLGIGGLVVPLLPPPVGLWVLLAAVAFLVVMLVVLVVSGFWNATAAWVTAVVLALAAGGLAAAPVGEGVVEAGKLARSIEFLHPLWLLLLLLIPVIIYFSRRSLAGLGPVRSKVAIGLRCALILFLALALAEARLRHQSENMTVIFVADLSLSVPEETDGSTGPSGAPINRRWERIKKFINDSVELRGNGHERDKAGLVVFGRRPRLELPPSDAPRFNFTEISGEVDGNYTDIAAALRLARASFPENTGQRIVLITDGNENLGNAEEQARLAKEKGVQIDVVPLAAGQRNENEVLVQSVEAPGHVEQGSQLPVRVLVRSTNPNLVVGTLTVKQFSGEHSEDVPGSPRKNVVLAPGLNTFSFKQPLTDEQRSYTYQAEFLPEFVANDKGEPLARGLTGDRPQNNRATTHVVARGQRRVLLIEPKKGDHQFLVKQLEAAGTSKFQVETKQVEDLPQEKGALGAMLSEYDSVVLANVPASDIAEGLNIGGDNLSGVITEAQQEVLRSNTHDQGCGLVMIGGPNAYGAGGWQGTPVEKALPVDCEIKALEVTGKGGLVMIMHASELANGNYWQKVIAKLAIKKLGTSDEVGVLYYDYQGGVKWHIPMQEIGEKRQVLLGMVDKLTPGDMPDFDPALKLAYDALVEEKRGLTTKHIILISDGDPAQNDKNLLQKMRNARVTCTTVGVATHGSPQDQSLATIATATKGRFYSVKSANALPEIYTKETRLVSQSFVYEKKFTPRLVYRSGPTEALPDQLEALYGFVRTSAKPSALVETPIITPQFAGQDFPILSYWHYGLGKSVAFTSDARTHEGKLGWDRDWAKAAYYGKFWEQVIDWSLRPVESKKLVMSTEYHDGKVRVVVDARDEKGRPMVNLNLQGKVTTPGNEIDDKGLKFEQKNSGVYEAEFKAEQAGSYFVTAGPTRTVKIKAKDGQMIEHEELYDRASAGVTVPYSPEFADLESNTALLEKIRALTDGKSYADDPKVLEQVARDGEVFREGLPRFRSLQPIWYWLVCLAGMLLFFDVAVRRIALEPLEAVVVAQGAWDRLRGRRSAAEKGAEFLERLKTRKAQISETLDKSRAARRFEGGDAPVAGAPPPTAAEGPVTAPRRPAPRPAGLGVGPQPEQEPVDYASRLMKAKKKVWQDREQKPNE
jgi:Mg-chelatase subunit ChlD/uncharacterized membrane protein